MTERVGKLSSIYIGMILIFIFIRYEFITENLGYFEFMLQLVRNIRFPRTEIGN